MPSPIHKAITIPNTQTITISTVPTHFITIFAFVGSRAAITPLLFPTHCSESPPPATHAAARARAQLLNPIQFGHPTSPPHQSLRSLPSTSPANQADKPNPPPSPFGFIITTAPLASVLCQAHRTTVSLSPLC
jgi:hypothetical protein